MRGLLCGTTAKNNEEYREIIKFRMNILLLMLFVGIITVTVALLVEFRWSTRANEHMFGVYTGAGSGLTFAAIVLWIKNKKLLSNDEKLKESRLSNTDERLQEINNKAFRTASIMLLVALYMVGFIGGIFYPILFKMLMGIIVVFIVTYLFSYKKYEKKM
jgi:vacuolar-type H+-ATPase subunit I/STV1